jgi:hypothetical protein
MLNQLKPHLKKPIGFCTFFFEKVDILSDFTRETIREYTGNQENKIEKKEKKLHRNNTKKKEH